MTPAPSLLLANDVAQADIPVDRPGIAVFFISAKTVDAGLRNTLVELLEDQGHEALSVSELNATQAAAAADIIGCTDRLAVAVVTIDLLPMHLDDDAHRKYRGFDNPKIPKAAERARYLVHTIFDRLGQFDPVVSTQSTEQAWQVVRQLFPDRETRLRAKAERMRLAFATEGALQNLTREGRRAKVELIELDGEFAIRKTYRVCGLRYMEREIEVLQQLGPIRPEVPKLLGRGENYIVISFVGEGRNLQLEHRRGPPAPLPLKVVRALANFIKACVREGFDPIDIRAPGNVMLTDKGLKVIDFELWRRCGPGMRPEHALCLRGVPAEDTERPRGVPAFSKPYSAAWYPLTLLTPESFLHDPVWLQRLKRGVNFLRLWSRWCGAALVRRVTRSAAGSGT